MGAKTVRVDSVIPSPKCDQCQGGPCRYATFREGVMLALMCSVECLEKWEAKRCRVAARSKKARRK